MKAKKELAFLTCCDVTCPVLSNVCFFFSSWPVSSSKLTCALEEGDLGPCKNLVLRVLGLGLLSLGTLWT